MKIVLAYFEKFIEMSGGIERVCCNMANAMAERGYEVSIIYCYGRSGKPFYSLDSSVKTYNLMAIHPEKWKNPSLSQCVSGMDKAVRESIRLFSKSKARDWNESVKGRMIADEVRQVLADAAPDIIISFRYETSNYLLHYAKTKIPVITMFHISPDFILPDAPRGEIEAIQESNAAQVLLKRDIPIVEKFCPGAHVVWIPNAVPQYKESADLSADKKVYTILNVARLNKAQKRQHLLVEAFARIAADFPNWQVELWGGGNESGAAYAEELRALIHHHHLEDRVFLKGESGEIWKQYMRADIFCFPSAYEGFPLSMTEAMSAGLPVAAYRSCHAVADMIRQGETGLLAEDGPEALAFALRQLMGNKQMRIMMGQHAREAMAAYAPDHIWDMWEILIRKMVKGN